VSLCECDCDLKSFPLCGHFDFKAILFVVIFISSHYENDVRETISR